MHPSDKDLASASGNCALPPAYRKRRLPTSVGTRDYMSRIERGLANPSLDAVEVIAVALHVEVDELF